VWISRYEHTNWLRICPLGFHSYCRLWTVHYFWFDSPAEMCFTGLRPIRTRYVRATVGRLVNDDDLHRSDCSTRRFLVVTFVVHYCDLHLQHHVAKRFVPRCRRPCQTQRPSGGYRASHRRDAATLLLPLLLPPLSIILANACRW